MTVQEINKYFEKQYLHYGGFCPTCGEGCKPLLNNDADIFGLCEYNGHHPNCGNHDMVFVERTPETFGGYEIWECEHEECTYQEAI